MSESAYCENLLGENNNMEYCDHLFKKNTDGYIQLIQVNDRTAIKIYNTQYKTLRNVVEEVAGEEDIYISSNTYYKPKRAVSNIRQFRALYIDLDLIYYKSETVYRIYELVNQNKIPMPSLIVDSGRGIHLYWRIENAPYGAIQTWQELEDYLYHNLKGLGADIKATDGARVLRLPNTINSKNNEECKILAINDDIQYSMYDLREQYLNYKPKSYEIESYQIEFEQTQAIKPKNKCVITKMFNSYSLHLARIEDIKTLCKLRSYDVEGYRNFIVHVYAYWNGIYVRDPQDLEKQVFELNDSFKKPLKENEIMAVLRCIPKAIDKFIAYQQGLNSGQAKKVTKGMRDKGGYWYKNETLIERLDISAEEQKHLVTIIGIEEKYKRNNENRKANRRNEEGFTEREQNKATKERLIKNLISKGLNKSQIAKELGLNRSTITRSYGYLFI